MPLEHWRLEEWISWQGMRSIDLLLYGKRKNICVLSASAVNRILFYRTPDHDTSRGFDTSSSDGIAQGAQDGLRIQRKLSNPDSRGVVDGIGDGC